MAMAQSKHTFSKASSPMAVKKAADQRRQKGETIGLCHGCFDILHFGHLRHFEAASAKCDFLVVSVTADQFVKKGPNRPIFAGELRAELVSGLACVGAAFVSEYPTAIETLNFVRPNFFFKGQDYLSEDKIFNRNFLIERDHARKIGVEVIHTQEDNFSSSEILLKLGKIPDV